MKNCLLKDLERKRVSGRGHFQDRRQGYAPSGLQVRGVGAQRRSCKNRHRTEGSGERAGGDRPQGYSGEVFRSAGRSRQENRGHAGRNSEEYLCQSLEVQGREYHQSGYVG